MLPTRHSLQIQGHIHTGGMEKGIPHKWKSAEKVAIFISDKIDFKDCYKRQKYTLHVFVTVISPSYTNSLIIM